MDSWVLISAMNKDFRPFYTTSTLWGIRRVLWDVGMTLNRVVGPKIAWIYASVHFIMWRGMVIVAFLFIFSM
jgi:hypothetical protein